jgi:hypothetical protein
VANLSFFEFLEVPISLYAEGSKLAYVLEKAPIPMNHVVLLGDSILDNGAYVAGGSPLVEQLRSRLHGDWRVTLLARDGAVAEYVLRQLQQLPADATHLSNC